MTPTRRYRSSAVDHRVLFQVLGPAASLWVLVFGCCGRVRAWTVASGSGPAVGPGDRSRLQLFQGNGEQARPGAQGPMPTMRQQAQTKGGLFRAVTFNTWQNGANVEGGLAKIRQHIEYLDADVVFLQEISSHKDFANLTAGLGAGWQAAVHHRKLAPDVGILSRHPMALETLATTTHAVGIKLFLSGNTRLNMSVWSVHLQEKGYGPYAACDKLTTDSTQIMAGEFALGHNTKENGRVQNIRHLLALSQFQQAMRASSQEPVIVAGDFSSPSDLDWTETSAYLHCGWKFEWPATRILTKNGFRDSFRVVHPDPLIEPGHTWSPIRKFKGPDFGWIIPEPQDRVDFIFFMGGRLDTKNSQVYNGIKDLKTVPFHRDNDFPSDHSALITDFQLLP